MVRLWRPAAKPKKCHLQGDFPFGVVDVCTTLCVSLVMLSREYAGAHERLRMASLPMASLQLEVLNPSAAPGVRSHGRFRNSGPAYHSGSGVKWMMSGGTKRQCDRASPKLTTVSSATPFVSSASSASPMSEST